MWISVRFITEESIVIVKRSDIAILLNPIHLGGVMVSVLITSSEDVGLDDKNVDAFLGKPSSSTLYSQKTGRKSFLPLLRRFNPAEPVVEKPLEDQNVSCISPHVVKSVILKDFEIKFVLNNGRNKFSFSCLCGL